MRAARLVLWLSVVTFAAFGLAFTARPRGMAAFVGIVLPTDTAVVDFAATYGGMEIGVAAFLWICTRRETLVRLGLLASACALGGLAMVRLAGIVSSATVEPILYVLVAAEIGGTALSLWAARLAPAPAS